MQGYSGGNVADRYLVQRIQGASPEQLVVILLEGAQRFLNQASTAIRNRDIPGKARSINKVSAIIEELTVWLDFEKGGDVATNLARVYDWWLHELFEASQANSPDRLDHLMNQISDIRGAWEDLHRQKSSAQPGAPVSTGEGLVG